MYGLKPTSFMQSLLLTRMKIHLLLLLVGGLKGLSSRKHNCCQFIILLNKSCCLLPRSAYSNNYWRKLLQAWLEKLNVLMMSICNSSRWGCVFNFPESSSIPHCHAIPVSLALNSQFSPTRRPSCISHVMPLLRLAHALQCGRQSYIIISLATVGASKSPFI